MNELLYTITAKDTCDIDDITKQQALFFCIKQR